MENNTAVKRLFKRGVITIDDNDQSAGQPAEKVAKKEEESVPSPSPPSQEVLELRQKVVKLEDMYQRAVQSAADAQHARRTAETLLDSKRGILDESKADLDQELQKRLADISAQLGGARRRAELAIIREIESARESDALKIEMVEVRRREEIANCARYETARENSYLKEQLNDTMRAKGELLRENASLREELAEARREIENVKNRDANDREVSPIGSEPISERASSPKSIRTRRISTSSSSSNEEEDEEEQRGERVEEGRDWEISCICGITKDNGEIMVACDQCIRRWEHVDCIFPRTKRAPPGLYFCHVCKPRRTELTPEQARAYQDGVKKQKAEKIRLEKEKKDEERKKEEEEKKASTARKAMTDHDYLE